MLFINLEKIIGNRVFWFGPENSVAFNIELQLELSVLSSSNVLSNILQDDVVDELANKLGVVYILTTVLL